MIEFVCMFLSELAEPAKARALAAQPGVFATFGVSGAKGLGRAAAEQCSITLCEPGGVHFSHLAYVGSNTCPIAPTSTRFIGENGVDAFGYTLIRPIVSGFLDRADRDAIAIVGDTGGVQLAPTSSPAINGLRVRKVTLAPLDGGAIIGDGFLLGSAGTAFGGLPVIERALRALERDGANLSRLLGFVLHEEAMVALVGDTVYAGRFASEDVLNPVSGLISISLPPITAAEPTLHRMARATCRMIGTDLVFQRLTVDIYRLETNLDRLNDHCD